MAGPLERRYRAYRFVFRLAEHTEGQRPSPHVEVWKSHRKIGNYDFATGEPLFNQAARLSEEARGVIEGYIRDPQVREKILGAARSSLFNLAKPAGTYGGVPRGVRVIVTAQFID